MSALAKALLQFQKEAPPIHLDATNPHFKNKYASLGGVVAAIRPALNKVGVVYTQLPAVTDLGQASVETKLIHAESGEELSSVMPLVMSKQDPQGQGSALTYARRYALLSVLGLVGDEDDDANSATRRPDARTADALGLQSSRADAPPETSNGDGITIHFGKNKGKLLTDLSAKQIEWYANVWEPNPDFANQQDYALQAAARNLAGVEAAGPDIDDSIPF